MCPLVVPATLAYLETLFCLPKAEVALTQMDG